jgi:hypothetical protein
MRGEPSSRTRLVQPRERCFQTADDTKATRTTTTSTTRIAKASRSSAAASAKVSMTMIQLLFLVQAISWQQSRAQGVAPYSSAIPCPTDATVNGYTTIGTLNADMAAERDRIAGGGAPQTAPYTFTLCPQTSYDAAAEPIKPVLDNMSILCGTSGATADSCVITGGTNQVQIDDSTVDTYPINSVSLVGLTYTGFTETAVSGGASDSTQVTLLNNAFKVSQSDTSLYHLYL